jgi:hypothetical protein
VLPISRGGGECTRAEVVACFSPQPAAIPNSRPPPPTDQTSSPPKNPTTKNPPPKTHHQKPTTNQKHTAIECFSNAGAIVVPRERFAPVKTCSDLLVLRSDAYTLTEDWTVEPTKTPVPLVKLDDSYYKLVDKFERLFPRVPSLVKCTSLTVKGCVRFGAGVVVEGEVVVEAAEGSTSAEPSTVSGVTLTSGKHALQKAGVVDVSADGAGLKPAMA